MLHKNGLFIQMTSLNSPAHLTQILSPDTTDAVPWDGSKFGIVSIWDDMFGILHGLLDI